jgi:hypothetical protein
MPVNQTNGGVNRPRGSPADIVGFEFKAQAICLAISTPPPNKIYPRHKKSPKSRQWLIRALF